MLRRIKRFWAIALCSLLGFESNAYLAQLIWKSERAIAAVPLMASSSGSPTSGNYEKEHSEGKDKGLFDVILGGITEVTLKKKLQNLSKNGAPLTVSTDNLYQRMETLPGKTFKPALLDLRHASANTVIPAGDYVLPVRVFCMQHQAGSPNGHRYQLGHFGGTRQKVLQAFNRAAALNKKNYSQAELQGVSWAIQAGVAYDDMPSDMKAIIDAMIPDQKDGLKRNTINEIRHVWNDASHVLNLPSLENYLVSNLGDAGRVIVRLMGIQDTITATGRDWRNLSSTFVTSGGESSSGGAQSTPWSDLGNGIYGRFLTQGNYSSPGFLELRIAGNPSEPKEKGLVIAQKGSSTAPRKTPNGVAASQLEDTIAASVAVPEGNGSIQPLAMAPEDDSWWSRNRFTVIAGGIIIGGIAVTAVIACTVVTDGLCLLAVPAAEGVAGGTAGGTATAGGAEIAIVAPGAGAAIGGAEAVGTITASDSLATVEAIQAATKATEFSSTAAAEAAEVAAINAIRTELGVGQSRNIAYATAQIGEETEQFIGVSGQAARPGTVEVPENPIFQTFATGQNSRMFDSEVKILEEIASRYANNPDIQGTVRLVSERPPCVSCSSVIDQFKAMFPNIRVTVSHIGK